MKIFLFCLLLLGISLESYCQLVRKKDYDIAVALQLGGGTSVILPGKDLKVALSPVAGLKMTIPFNRKWFLGCEVNYTDLKFDSRYTSVLLEDQEGQRTSDAEVRFRMKQIHLPLYLKYRLNCNKASVLFGGYGSYNVQNKSEVLFQEQEASVNGLAYENDMEKWNAGITLGYEHQIVKHLNVMCRVNAGLRNIMHSKEICGKKIFPLQACITLSYDIFRVGDCGCD